MHTPEGRCLKQQTLGTCAEAVRFTDNFCGSVLIHASDLFSLHLKDMCKGVTCSGSPIFPTATQVSCSPHMNQHMANEIGPLPKGQEPWRENSAEIPNKIVITMKHLSSSYQDKNKLQNKTAKFNYQDFFFKKHH